MILTLIYLFLIKIRFPKCSPISTVIKERYDLSTLHLFTKYEKLSMKVDKLKQDLQFLNICKLHGVTPKFLRFKLYKQSLSTTPLYRSWQQQLLDLEIKDKENTISFSHASLRNLRNALKDSVSFLDFHGLCFFISRNNKDKKTRTIETHTNKLHHLGVQHKDTFCDPKAVIFNQSSHKLSPREEFLLAFGLEFCIPIFKPNRLKHYLPFEGIASRLKNEPLIHGKTFSDVCNVIKRAAEDMLTTAKKKPFVFHFKQKDVSILKSLAKNKNLIICPPDKGKGIVLLNKTDYTNKVTDLLSDTSKFFQYPEQEDLYKLSLKQEDKICRFLRKLLDNKIITKDQYNNMYPTGTGPGILYGSPKVHKQSTPMRPIVAAYNTAAFNLSKFLVPLLEPLTHNQHTIRNSYQFKDFLKRYATDSTQHMASFDIVSLFTNIPLDETIDIICSKLFSNTLSYAGMNEQTFRQFLNLACKESFFIFNGRAYRQTEGLNMGAPHASTFANIFLCHSETQWLKDCPKVSNHLSTNGTLTTHSFYSEARTMHLNF